METFFTLSILLWSAVAFCFFGPIGFLIIFVTGVIVQSRRRSVARQERMIAEMKEIKYKMAEKKND